MAHWKTTMQELVDAAAAAAEAGRPQDHAQGIKAVAHATLALEHCFTLPVVSLAPDGEEQQEPRPIDMRLLPAHWLSSVRHNWVQEMESVATLSHVGLLLEEFNLHALASWRELRACSTSQWWFNNETKKWQRDQAQERGRAPSDTPLVRAPGWRSKLHDLLNRPSSSLNARRLHFAVSSLIILSTVCPLASMACPERRPSMRGKRGGGR